MAGITGIGTTFNLPNYHGELFLATPTETPLLSAAGGLTGGKQTTSPAFEWQTEDLRAPENRPRLEGADAPTPESRVRANVENVVQIFHEAVATSYTKQAATGQYATPASAPFYSADGSPNPVGNEHSHQVNLALKTIARDVNYVFWHGRKVKPATNATPRQTGGLLEAMASNRIAAGEIAGLSSAASNAITETGHGLTNGDRIVFTRPPAELRYDRAYYAVDTTTNTFKVAASAGGAALTVANGQSNIAYVPAETAVSVDAVNDLLRGVFDNGGITEQDTATLYVPSNQKVALTKAYANEYGKADPSQGSRTVGGLSLETIVTPFGTLNVTVERALPPDAIAVVSMEQVDPVFLSIPGKGVLFEEELAKTGSADRTQIYGEIGLKWGNEAAHGVLRGLS